MEMKKLLNCDVPRLLPSPDQSNLNNETIRDIGFTFHPIGKIHMKIFSVPQQESNDKHSMKVYNLGADSLRSYILRVKWVDDFLFLWAVML